MNVKYHMSNPAPMPVLLSNLFWGNPVDGDLGRLHSCSSFVVLHFQKVKEGLR